MQGKKKYVDYENLGEKRKCYSYFASNINMAFINGLLSNMR